MPTLLSLWRYRTTGKQCHLTPADGLTASAMLCMAVSARSAQSVSPQIEIKNRVHSSEDIQWAHHTLTATIEHMGIDHRGGYVRVTE